MRRGASSLRSARDYFPNNPLNTPFTFSPVLSMIFGFFSVVCAPDCVVDVVALAWLVGFLPRAGGVFSHPPLAALAQRVPFTPRHNLRHAFAFTGTLECDIRFAVIDQML